MQIPVLNGVYTDGNADFRTSYPRNLVPVPKQQGISNGYLRPADGIELFGTGPGIGRGGINWNGVCYRAMGTKLVSIGSTGTATTLGEIGYGDLCSFDYSFDRLAVSSGGRLYYWNGATLTQVTDSDLGTVVDFVWIDGYFATTDGEYIAVTELNDPTSINPMKYGSSEVDPDRIVALVKLRSELYAANRYTMEVFQNIGGDGFPFQRIDGAQLQRGAVGTHAVTTYADSIAFVGSGRNEAVAVWIGNNSTAVKVSTREIDQILSGYTEDELSGCLMESRVFDGHQLLYVHLPDRTLVYDVAASQAVNESIWFTLTTSLVGNEAYKARNFVYCYNQWLSEDPTEARHGVMVDNVSSHYGEVVGWDFGTLITYNGGMGAIINQLELVALTGRVGLGANPTIWTSYSTDGQTWSVERGRSAGKIGERNKRLTWLQQGHMRNWRIQRFRGTSDSHMSIARLEAQIEPLSRGF